MAEIDDSPRSLISHNLSGPAVRLFTAIKSWNACGLHLLKQYRFRPKHDRANRLRAGTE